MKKYDIWAEAEQDGEGVCSSLEIRTSDEGEWVKYEDAEKLDQLNKEMLEVLREANEQLLKQESYLDFINEDCWDTDAQRNRAFENNRVVLSRVQSIITKAEGECHLNN